MGKSHCSSNHSLLSTVDKQVSTIVVQAFARWVVDAGL